MNAPLNPRLRVRFAKHGKVRFTSHRDVARVWERALRRVAMPVAYSEGFSPRPRLSFGLALPTGCASVGEYLDIELDRVRAGEVELGDELCRRLDAALPAGIDVQAVAPIERGGLSLQEAVVACTWEIAVAGTGSEPSDLPDEQARAWVAGVLAAGELPLERERKGKRVTDDVRPLVHALDMLAEAEAEGGTAVPGVGGSVRLRAVLGTRPRALRPSELLEAGNLVAAGDAHPPLRARAVCRMHQWIEAEAEEPGTSPDDEFDRNRLIMQGHRWTGWQERGLTEPLPLPATAAVPAALVGTRA